MSVCPHCQRALPASLAAAPPRCPHCGGELIATVERSSVQALDDASGSLTVQSDEFANLQPDQPAAHAPQAASATPQSEEMAGPSVAQTVQSNEFVLDSVGASAEAPLADQSSDLTVQSDQFGDVGALGTMMMEDGAAAAPAESGEARPDRTIQMDSGDDDPSLSKTLQADEFRGSGDSSLATLASDEFPEEGTQQTFLSDELPPEQAKTMQTMWEGAFQGGVKQHMTIKGKSSGKVTGSTSLVIKPRALAAPEDPPERRRQPEYELIRVLGEGGMGVVYDARQTSIDRSVAVKMLKAKTASDERQRQKFLAEAVVTGDLDHPNIVPIYDVGASERGLLFYAMKKVKGTPWLKLLPQKSQAENIEILMKVADAVAFAHSRGVIHRDLKPENVMLGDFGEVLVMDWGLALPAPGYAKAQTVATSHSMGGTPAYMAPEMASGPLEKISFASDVYLLGAMLYEIITGYPPHYGKNTMQCLFAAAKNEIRPTEKSGELVEIALRAMALNPADRYQSVKEFQEAIREFQEHIESVKLSTDASDYLAEARRTNDYRLYSKAIFAFEEAFKLWPGNHRAERGLAEARESYAQAALDKGDYDLGLSLLDAALQAHQPLISRLKAAQHEREARQQRLKVLKRVAGGMVALFVVVVSVALVWINSERNEANRQRLLAEENAQEANRQRGIAVANADEARRNADEAKRNADEAVKQRVAAVANAEEAQRQRTEAQTQRDEAEKARRLQAYEAYIAQIGLAAAKIDENAFGSARQILDNCAPELRNWEWGRLMYLCDQNVLEVDGTLQLDAVAFAADGSRFATGGWNKEAVIWSIDGQKLHTLPQQGLYVHAVAFSPDGAFVATGGSDRHGYVRLWNSRTGELLKTLEGHTDAVVSLRFSADGRRLLTGSYDKTARLWDVATGNALKVLKGHTWWVWSVALDHEGQRAATASQDGSVIIWSLASDAQEARQAQFLEHSGPVYAVAFAPDGQTLASAGYDKRVLLWRASDVRPFDFRRLAAGDQMERTPYKALEGHGASVRGVDFNADGSLVVSGGHDNTVKVWDVQTGRSLKTFRGHANWVRSCTFSPDGRSVLSAGFDGKARLWSIADYEEMRVLQGRNLKGHADQVLAVSFSNDGSRLVTASRDRTARTWEFKTGKPLARFDEGHAFLASNVVFFPDGSKLVTSAVDNTTRFWNVATGGEMLTLEHTGRAAALALSRDGTLLLTGSDKSAADGFTAQAWDASTGQRLAVLKGHKYEVTAVAIAPDGAVLATGDANGRVLLWDARDYRMLHKLTSHTGKITAMAFMNDGQRLLTASNDKTVGQWDVASGRELPAISLKHPAAVLSMAAVPTARQVITSCADDQVRLWDIDSGSMLAALPRKGPVDSVAVAPDGRRALCVSSQEHAARLWDLEQGREILAPGRGGQAGAFLDFKQLGGQVWSAAFSPDGEALVTVGGSDARLWSMNEPGKEQMSFSPNGVVAAASFSPDGRFVVTGSWDNSARIWDAETGRNLHKLEGEHSGFVNAALFSPDGRYVLTASSDKTAVLWDAATARPVKRLAGGHAAAITAAAFSPDGQFVLTGSADKLAILWNIETATPVARFAGHAWGVMSVAFSKDGRLIATGSVDTTARIWDVETRQTLLTLSGHTATVASVAFLPDPALPGSSRLLTGSLDNTAKLWDSSTGKEILTLKGHAQEVTSVGASTSGQYVVTGSRDGTAVVWLAKSWLNGPRAERVAVK